MGEWSVVFSSHGVYLGYQLNHRADAFVVRVQIHYSLLPILRQGIVRCTHTTQRRIRQTGRRTNGGALNLHAERLVPYDFSNCWGMVGGMTLQFNLGVGFLSLLGEERFIALAEQKG